MHKNNGDILFNLQHKSVLKAQPQQDIFYLYIYLYVGYQSVYTGSKLIETPFNAFSNREDPEHAALVRAA